jgi:hypothetical protein
MPLPGRFPLNPKLASTHIDDAGARMRRAHYCRRTTTLRHDVFPAASEARTVTVFDPISRGIEADHCEVPLAVPERPRFVDQVTLATPTLSVAVPENARLLAVV